MLQKNSFPRLLINKVTKELGDDASKNLKVGFGACGIVPFGPQQALKRIPRKDISNNDSWLQSFKKQLREKRSNETSVQTKKKRLTVPPGKSVSGVNEPILEQYDIIDMEIIFSDDNIIETDNEDDPVILNNPILIVVPSTDPVPSTSGHTNIGFKHFLRRRRRY